MRAMSFFVWNKNNTKDLIFTRYVTKPCKQFLPQLAFKSPICRCRQEDRQRFSSVTILVKHWKKWLRLTSILWLKKQNKTKQNKNKNKRTNDQIDSGLLWSEVVSTTIFVLTVNSTLDLFLYRWKIKDRRKAVKQTIRLAVCLD